MAWGKARTQSVACLNNLRQLQYAWSFYAQANSDALPPNISEKHGFIQTGVSNAWGNSWVWGNAQWDTNAANIEHGLLFADAGAAAVYRCPADKVAVTERPDLRRYRSYSADGWLNTHIQSGTVEQSVNDAPQNLRKLTQALNPHPARLFVFIDEHEESIDDGSFGIHNPWNNPGPQWWGASMPANRHSQGCNLTFADGHAVPYHWLSPNKGMPGGNIQRPADAGDLKDLERLQDGIPRG